MADQKENSELFFEKELLSPYNYFLQIKGKQLRIKIVFAFNHWLQLPTEKLRELLDILNMIYVSYFLCDDIQDGSNIRGVSPAAHCIYGVPLTINASIQALLLGLERASNLSSEACKVIIEEYLEVIRGQGIEIYWRDNFICPTEEQFRKMLERKSCRFVMLIIRFIQLFSKNKTDYTKLVVILGTYLQIHDDYCNLNHQKACTETRFCEDITEGKFTLPIIHAMKTPYGEQILNILRQRTRDVDLKRHCVSLLEKAGSLQYTRDAMNELDREARAEITRLGGNSMLEAILDQFLEWQT
ncbi:unnamed protein product [Euphydryas editha]|uniref:Geranylgeranyl pyrophosphate synthase n=1 Tax=Euphydryas editha TaxID=104508 RepID=A0AAU9V0C2_EUPED|nr:unnamed protein product [Euphydryas editha]